MDVEHSVATHRQRFKCCGVPIDSLPLHEAVNELIHRTVRGPVHLCNAYTLSLAVRDPRLNEGLARSTRNHPDGMPLVWLGRRLGLRHLDQRVYGPELMRRVLDHGRTTGLRHVLFGGDPNTLERLVEAIGREWEGTHVVAMPTPFTDDLETFAAAAPRIAAVQPDIVWVGLGTPKQDLVVDRLSSELPDAAVVAIGAAFDFLAGTKRQSPPWLGAIGLEWAYRLAAEPRRLWRRYLIGNARFIAAARHSTHLLPIDDADRGDPTHKPDQ